MLRSSSFMSTKNCCNGLTEAGQKLVTTANGDQKPALQACPGDFEWDNWIQKSKGEMVELACLNFFHRMQKLQYKIKFLTQEFLDDIRLNGLRVQQDDSGAEDQDEGEAEGEQKSPPQKSWPQNRSCQDSWSQDSWSQDRWHRNSWSQDRWTGGIGTAGVRTDGRWNDSATLRVKGIDAFCIREWNDSICEFLFCSSCSGTMPPWCSTKEKGAVPQKKVQYQTKGRSTMKLHFCKTSWTNRCC